MISIDNILTLGSYIIPVIGTGLFSIWAAKISQTNKSLQKNNTDLSNIVNDYQKGGVTVELDQIQELYKIFDTIFKETNIDRILILSARNGDRDFRLVTAHLEYHNLNDHPKVVLSMGATGRYVNFNVDTSYTNMLNYIKYNKHIYYKVDDMDESLLKSIYLEENVFDSSVYYATTKRIDEANLRMFYVSYASHDKPGHKHQSSIIKRYHDQISAIIDSFE